MKRLILFFVTSLLIILTLPRAVVRPAAAQGKTGLVLAHYYAWYDPNAFAAGKTPFKNPNPYFSTDRATIQRQVDQARAAGIDGFVQAWYGPDSSQQTEPNFRTLLEVAGGSGFKAAVTFEPVSAWMGNNEVRASALSTLLATHAQHPAYLRMDGKPVIFFWANWALSVADWEAIRNSADPNRNSIWIAEGGALKYLSVFDGMYLYNIAWSPDPAGINIRWGGETRGAAGTYGGTKYWVATAMPGFNDSLLGRGSNTIVRDRGDGAYFRSSFSGAAQSGADLIVITSFNEWAEGSHIEPSQEFGDFYLNLARELITTYKGGGIPAAAPLPPASGGGSSGGSGGQPAAVVSQQQGPTNTPFPTRTPIPTATARPDGRIIHVVEPGDTLISIAIRYSVDLQDLYQFNNLGPNSLLSIGQEITIGLDQKIVAGTATAAARQGPPATGTPAVLQNYPNTTIREEDGAIIYLVREGNTLIEIALIYGVDMPDIFSWNQLNENSLISINQPIIVGYVPTPKPEAVGGSADLPQEAPTATPSPSPTATASATATAPPPTPTAPATAVSALPTAPAPTAEPLPVAAAGSSQTTSRFLSVLFIIVGALALAGAGLIYLGRRV